MKKQLAGTFVLAMQIAVFAILASTVHNSVADTGAPLSRWMHETAAPLLAKRLAEHPRLRGQQLTLIAGSNELSRSLSLQLETALLTHTGVLLSRKRQGCETTNNRLELHVRILPHPDSSGRNSWRVQLDFRDPSENLWIGGLGTHWIGTLQRPEQIALATPASTGQQADPESLADTAGVATALQLQISCHMRRPDSLLHWPLAWQQTEQTGELRAIQTTLDQWLGNTSQPDAREPTQLRLSIADDDAGQTLSLWAQKQFAQHPKRQLVASLLLAPESAVMPASMASANSSLSPSSAQQTLADAAQKPVHSESPLLSDFTIRGTAKRTASIRLHQDAFVLALRVQTDPASGARTLSALNCADPARHRSAGEIRYRFNGFSRIRSDDFDNSPEQAAPPSLYLLATRSQSSVEMLRPLLRQLTCDASMSNNAGEWLQRFSRWQQKHEVEWRVTHFGEQPAALAATGHNTQKTWSKR